MYGFDHFGMGLGGLLMILVWAVLVVLIFLLYRYFSGHRGQRQNKTALDILDERYARGEIDREEYLNGRADLGGRPGACRLPVLNAPASSSPFRGVMPHELEQKRGDIYQCMAPWRHSPRRFRQGYGARYDLRQWCGLCPSLGNVHDALVMPASASCGNCLSILTTTSRSVMFLPQHHRM
jgi:putative membrane protein